jgi:hypothetical protein
LRAFTADIISDRVIINDKIYDFIIECSGWKDNDEYLDPFLETVNSAFLFSENIIYDNSYTLHLATEDGWMFGLPFPDENLTKFGYLYNNKWSNFDFLSKKFKDNNTQTKHISWTPKYSRNFIQSKNIAYNGNRLFFLEPLQALSLNYYHYFAEQICIFLNTNRDEKEISQINFSYLWTMIEYQHSLAFHYKFGSIHKTDFWSNIKQKSTLSLQHSNPNSDLKILFTNYLNDLKFNSKLCSIGVFNYDDLKTLSCGMNDININDQLNQLQLI